MADEDTVLIVIDPQMVGHLGVRVTVMEALTGIRASSLTSPSGVSKVEATRRRLESCGVAIVRSMELLETRPT